MHREQACEQEVLVPKLSREQFRELFGFELPPELTPEERSECVRINGFFDTACECGISEREVFRQVYRDPVIADEKFREFIRNLLSCPQEVLDHIGTIRREALQKTKPKG